MARIVTIGHVGLHAADVQQLTAFYTDIVGLKPVVCLPDLTIFELGDASPHPHLFITPGEGNRAGPSFDWAADDVVGLHAQLREAGVECSPITHSATSGHSAFPSWFRAEIRSAWLPRTTICPRPDPCAQRAGTTFMLRRR